MKSTSSMTYQLPPVNDSEFHTIIAALRLYQYSDMGEPHNRTQVIHDLATDGGNCISLNDEGIDDLVVKLNTESSDSPTQTTNSGSGEDSSSSETAG